MIELGLHTDNWRPVSMSFEASCDKIAAVGINTPRVRRQSTARTLSKRLVRPPASRFRPTRSPCAATSTRRASRSRR